LVVFLIVAFVSAQGLWHWVTTRPPTRIPLTEGISGQTRQERSDALDERLKAAFPLGSPEAEMWAVLRKQGFARRDRGSSFEQERLAVAHEGGFLCSWEVLVSWRADTNGRLTSISGRFGREACA
jgi:hypothetical protein